MIGHLDPAYTVCLRPKPPRCLRRLHAGSLDRGAGLQALLSEPHAVRLDGGHRGAKTNLDTKTLERGQRIGGQVLSEGGKQPPPEAASGRRPAGIDRVARIRGREYYHPQQQCAGAAEFRRRYSRPAGRQEWPGRQRAGSGREFGSDQSDGAPAGYC